MKEQFNFGFLNKTNPIRTWSDLKIKESEKIMDLADLIAKARLLPKSKFVKGHPDQTYLNNKNLLEAIDLQTRLFKEGLLGNNASKAIDGKIGANTKRALNISLLRLLINLGLLDNSKGNADDGVMGKNSNNALAEALKQGYILKNGILSKKEEPKTSHTTYLLLDDFNDGIISGVKKTPGYRAIHHSIESIKNGFDKVSENIELGNYGRALYSGVGAALDIPTNGITAIGLKVAPSYTMPFKDALTTSYNRLGRAIFNDDDYTAVRGHLYTNDDYSDSFNKVAEQVAKEGGGKKPIDKLVKENVDASLDYGSSALLKYPFNATAAYAWTVGRVSPKINEDGSISVADPYDNSNRKTSHYLNKLTRSLSDLARGVGGIFTSHDDEPDEGKNISRLTY